MNIKEVDERTVQKFKAWCNLQGITVKDAIVQYMKEKGDQVRLDKGN